MTTPDREAELFKELTQAIQSISYGSILLTIHEGRLVEITKTERIRKVANRASVEK